MNDAYLVTYRNGVDVIQSKVEADVWQTINKGCVRGYISNIYTGIKGPVVAQVIPVKNVLCSEIIGF